MPTMLVKKGVNGIWTDMQFGVDLRRFNDVILADRYKLPRDKQKNIILVGWRVVHECSHTLRHAQCNGHIPTHHGLGYLCCAVTVLLLGIH